MAAPSPPSPAHRSCRHPFWRPIVVSPTTGEAEPTLIVSELTPKSFFGTLLGDILKTNLFTTDLITLAIVRDPTDPNLVLPNISDRDY